MHSAPKPAAGRTSLPEVREGDMVYRIVSVHEEGRRKYLHIKVKKSDADN